MTDVDKTDTPPQQESQTQQTQQQELHTTQTQLTELTNVQTPPPTLPLLQTKQPDLPSLQVQPRQLASLQTQPPPIKEEETGMCHCESDCLNLNCPCFRRGRYCDPNCKCPKCKNNEEHARERLEAIEQILSKDPMAFTAEETLNQEECASICNFAMLTSSVDAQPFQVTPRESCLSKLLTSEVINQAIRTVMSAANDDLKSATSENFEEHAENSVSKEFENVLQAIVTHAKPSTTA